MDYIVTLSNDTLRGTIVDDKFLRSNDAVYFVQVGQVNKTKYTPVDIKSFSSHHDLYISVVADIDYSPVEITQLRESPEPDMNTDTIFLKVLSSGEASLLFFRDNNSKPHYFIAIGDSIRTELINYSYLALAVNTDYDKDYLRTMPKYRGILSYYFADCPTAVKIINELNYSEKAFLNIFEKYNQCHPETAATYIEKSKQFEYEIRVLTGVGRSEMYYIYESDPVFTDITYQPQFCLGSGFNIKMNSRLKTLSFNNELVLSRFNSTASVSYSNGIVNNYNEAHMTSLDFSLNTMVKATFPIKLISPYFTFGMRNSLVYFLENEVVRNSTIASTTTSASSPLLEFYKHYSFGLALGFGVNYKDIGFELRYNPQYGMDIDKRLIVSYSTSSVNLVVSYRLNTHTN